jgi:uncharacterized protein YgbK (DUF1537 family)
MAEGVQATGRTMVEVAFYGDDFTGSTDALAQFSRCGLRSVLLVKLPPVDELRKLASEYDVIGVAGIARSLAPDEQEAEIRPILTALRDLGPRVVQYKICSTADSSPTLGSLGRALEVGRSIFGAAVVPVLAAQPELGRYTVFSHHFAAEAGTIHRLDRQPTMANHPATPMTESDLRLHLAAQTNLRIGAIHLTAYDDLAAVGLPSTELDVVILDALTDDDLRAAGRAVVAAGTGAPVFAMGSGGLSRALAMELTQGGDSPAVAGDGLTTGEGDRHVLVVSGSQSARTREQIERAAVAGWEVLQLGDGVVAQQVVLFLRAGVPGVVVHSGRSEGRSATEVLGSLARELAEVVSVVSRGTDVRRFVIAGGDTSGSVLRELGVTALELVPTSDRYGPGVALCRTVATDPVLDGLEVLLKPGQLGAPDLFETIRTT